MAVVVAPIEADETLAPHVSPFYDAWRRFARNPLALFGVAIVAVLVLGAIFAPLTWVTTTPTSWTCP